MTATRQALELVYLDTSAYVKRFAQEDGSRDLQQRISTVRSVSSVLLWPESMSAVARKARAKVVTEGTAGTLRAHIRDDLAELILVRLSSTVLEEAERLLMAHPLRAADAVHLGSALRVASGRAQPLPFLTSDRVLASAAEQEGLAVETFGA